MELNHASNHSDAIDEKKILIDHLTPHFNTLKSTYRGYCLSITNKNIARRIDIKYIDYKSKYTAIIYFTGSKNYNTEIRNIAKKKGYKLNEYCLEKLDTKEKIYPKTEQELLKLLDIPYKEPKDRL